MVITNHLKIVGVVPASGASQRMGRDKALLELEGRTFVQRAVDALRSGGCDDIIVVVPGVPTTIRAAALDTDARVLTNPDPGEGPITSMLSQLGIWMIPQTLSPGFLSTSRSSVERWSGDSAISPGGLSHR